MAGRNLVRESFVVALIIVLSASAAGSLLNVALGLSEPSRRAPDLTVAGVLLAVVLGLGFLLRRIVEFAAES